MPDPIFAPQRRVIDVSKDALALMCDALQALGDSYAIYGFSGDGRDNVEFHVAKDFADKLSLRTWGALAAMHRAARHGWVPQSDTQLANSPGDGWDQGFDHRF